MTEQNLNTNPSNSTKPVLNVVIETSYQQKQFIKDKLCLSKKEYLMQRQSTSMRVISYLMIKGEPTLRFNQFFYFS